MRLNQIRYFAAVYEEGSITLAAKRENATQSGISMQIKDLETRLGVKLFERTSSGVKPTLPGEQFYGHATRILRELSDIEYKFGDLEDDDAGELNIGLMPTFTRAILAPSLVRFSKLRPHTRLKVIEAYSGFLTEEIGHQRLDFAIVPANSNVHGITTQYLATDTEFLLTSVNTDRPHLQSVDLRKEQGLRIIVPGTTNARRNKIDTYLATIGVTPQRIMELDAMMGTLDLVASSDWVTILPGVLCAPDRAGRERKIHPLSGLALTVDYVLIESSTKPMPPAARMLAQIIEAEMKALILEASDWSKSADALPERA